MTADDIARAVVADGPRDHRAQPRARRAWCSSASRPAACRLAEPLADDLDQIESVDHARSARSTWPSTATTSGCGRSCPRRSPTSPFDLDRQDRRAGRRRALHRPHHPGRPRRPGRLRAAPGGAAGGDGRPGPPRAARSAPTTWARTCPPGATRWSTSDADGRRAGGDAQVRHLLSIADLGADGIEELLGSPTPSSRSAPGHPEGAGAAGQDRRVALLRGLDPHPAQLRDRGQAAGRRHHDLHASARRRSRRASRSATPSRRSRPWGSTPSWCATRSPGVPCAGRPVDRRRRSSTPATAGTSTPPRPCSTATRSASACGSLDGRRIAIVGDIKHSRVARSDVAGLHRRSAPR